MAEPTSSTNTLCVADCFGDVILVVGEGIDPHTALNIQVSSHVLGLVSTVFKAMFSSRYHEGAMLIATAGQPVSIALPDDNPEAVSLACRLFHYQLDDTLEGFSLRSLRLIEKLAMFCDKYDCARAISPSVRLWSRYYDCFGGMPGVENLLLVSYLFDDPAFFGKITRGLVGQHTGSYMDFVAKHGRNILPSCICYALEEKRKIVNSRIMVAVHELIEPLMVGHEASVAAYFKELYRIGVFPARLTTSVQSTIDSIKTFDACILNTLNCPCRICLSVGDISKKVTWIGINARNWLEGICLDCMRHGGRNTGKCRIIHD